MQRASVVLPAPDSPTIAMHRCGSTSSETSSRTGLSPYIAPNPSIRSSGRSASTGGACSRSGSSPSAGSRLTSSARRHRAQCVATVELDTPAGTRSCTARVRTRTARRRSTRSAARPVAAAVRPSPRARARAWATGSRAARPRVYGCAGARNARCGRSELDQPPGVHHPDRVRDVGHDGEIVADVHGADVVDPAHATDRVEHVALGRHVEAGGRLVEDDQLRPARERHREHHPLLLPARQLMRI